MYDYSGLWGSLLFYYFSNVWRSWDISVSNPAWCSSLTWTVVFEKQVSDWWTLHLSWRSLHFPMKSGVSSGLYGLGGMLLPSFWQLILTLIHRNFRSCSLALKRKLESPTMTEPLQCFLVFNATTPAQLFVAEQVAYNRLIWAFLLKPLPNSWWR